MQYCKWHPAVMGKRRTVWHIVHFTLGDSKDCYWTWCDRDMDPAFCEETKERPEKNICPICKRKANQGE